MSEDQQIENEIAGTFGDADNNFQKLNEFQNKDLVFGTFGQGEQNYENLEFKEIEVNPLCTIQNVHVYKDYSCTLVIDDISYNQISSLRIFTIQLLERNDKLKWTVWSSNGKGQLDFQNDQINQQSEKIKWSSFVNSYFDLDQAKLDFEKQFKDKTANRWSDRSFFKEKPGKFKFFDQEKKKKELLQAQNLEKQLTQFINEKKDIVDSYLDEEIQNLVKNIFNIDEMQKCMVDLGLNIEKLPIGLLNQNKIDRAHKIISEIQKLLLQGKNTQIPSLTNEFYQLIQHDFGMQVPPLIDHLVKVKEKSRLLEQLQDIMILQEVLQKIQNQQLLDKSPWDVYYNELQVQIKILEREDNFFKVIYQSVINTLAEAHSIMIDFQVANIYEINKPSQNYQYQQFERKLHNKFLLWHGVKMQSLASILRNGLRVPNINSAHAGYMFGKGLYFNDCFSKALLSSFSNKRQKNERVYVILCEVALGDMHQALAPNQFSKAPIYCHSIYGVGQYKPNNQGIKDLKQAPPDFYLNKNTFDQPNCLFINTGNMEENIDLKKIQNQNSYQQQIPDLKFNEFVVFDQAQVKVKYIIECDVFHKQ